MEVRVFATLRDVVGGKSVRVDVGSAMSVQQLLVQLLDKYPDLRPKLLTEDGQLNPSVHILVNGRDVRFLQGLETVITAQDTVQMFPPVGGG